MGKGGEAEVAPPPAEPSAPDDSPQTDAKEARFLSALQAMVGGAELTEDSVRSAIASLSPAQRQQLLAEGQDLKRDLLTNQERKEDRNLYFKEVNNSADQAGLPVDKDGAFLAKKVRRAAASAHLGVGRILGEQHGLKVPELEVVDGAQLALPVEEFLRVLPLKRQLLRHATEQLHAPAARRPRPRR